MGAAYSTSKHISFFQVMGENGWPFNLDRAGVLTLNVTITLAKRVGVLKDPVGN